MSKINKLDETPFKENYINLLIYKYPTEKTLNSHYASYHFFNVSGAEILFLYLLTSFENDASFFVFFFLLFTLNMKNKK